MGLELRLGFSPPAHAMVRGIPKLLSTDGLQNMDEFPNAVYVGLGSLKHKLKLGILSTPFRPGPGGDPVTCVALSFQRCLLGTPR